MGLRVAGEPGEAEVIFLPRRRVRRWPRRLVLVAVALLVATAAVLALLAATYQPLRFAGQFGGVFPGMPAAQGARVVNDFAGDAGELYVPPELGRFSLVTSVRNTGPEQVTLEAVSLAPPGSGEVSWALRRDGAVAYRSAAEPATIEPGTLAHALALAPGVSVELAVPVRFSERCFETGAWTRTAQLFVEERFFGFTHWVPVSLGRPLVIEEPLPAGTPGERCLR